jgi:hypothetical protein
MTGLGNPVFKYFLALCALQEAGLHDRLFAGISRPPHIPVAFIRVQPLVREVPWEWN